MPHRTSSPRRTPILLKTVTTLTILALVATILVPEFTLLTAIAISGIYFAIGIAFSILPTLSHNSPTY